MQRRSSLSDSSVLRPLSRELGPEPGPGLGSGSGSPTSTPLTTTVVVSPEARETGGEGVLPMAPPKRGLSEPSHVSLDETKSQGSSRDDVVTSTHPPPPLSSSLTSSLLSLSATDHPNALPRPHLLDDPRSWMSSKKTDPVPDFPTASSDLLTQAFLFENEKEKEKEKKKTVVSSSRASRLLHNDHHHHHDHDAMNEDAHEETENEAMDPMDDLDVTTDLEAVDDDDDDDDDDEAVFQRLWQSGYVVEEGDLILNAYEVGQPIAYGSSSTVHLATLVTPPYTRYALKVMLVMPPPSSSSSSSSSLRSSFSRRSNPQRGLRSSSSFERGEREGASGPSLDHDPHDDDDEEEEPEASWSTLAPMHEIQVWHQLHHPHIVALQHVVATPECVLVFAEYMPHGFGFRYKKSKT
ncbi:hypothetical protein HMI55_004330 [Coelomomyces lativittatus]|nr:hypothetical protein HMI55_004330 [Coelomomyces lativittatus]